MSWERVLAIRNITIRKLNNSVRGDVIATILAKDQNELIQLPGKTKELKVPNHIENELIKPLPEDTGVYYFFDHEDNLIYIGKSLKVF